LHDELHNQFNCEKQAEEDDDDDVDKRKTTRRHDVYSRLFDKFNVLGCHFQLHTDIVAKDLNLERYKHRASERERERERDTHTHTQCY
jgi:hypothetical protein